MSTFRCLLIAVGSLTVCAMLTGCDTVKHNLHPDRLWRLNRGPAVGQVDASFSLSDEAATANAAAWRAIVREESPKSNAIED